MTDDPLTDLSQPPDSVWNPELDIAALAEQLRRRLDLATDEEETTAFRALLADAEAWLAEAGEL